MGGYKEYKLFDLLKRKSTIIKYIASFIIIFIVMIVLIVQNTKEIMSKNITFTENSKVGYNVYLKENDFFEEKYLNENNQYIAGLIDYIEANFNYNLEGSKKDYNYKYMYRIDAEVKVEDKNNHNSLYTNVENLIEEKEHNANTNSELKINESVKIDYNKYNDIINKFIDLYDLDDSNSSVTINMYVNLLDGANKKENKEELPVVSLKVPLTTKTVAVDIESNTVNDNNISGNKAMNNGKYFIALVLLIIEVILAVKFVKFINDTEDEDSVYNMLVNKILANYGSYIQKINREFDFKGYQSIEIKNFEDLLQIRELVQEPILMLKGNDETHFMVPTQGKLIYIYQICKGNTKKRIVEKTQDTTNNYEINI